MLLQFEGHLLEQQDHSNSQVDDAADPELREDVAAVRLLVKLVKHIGRKQLGVARCLGAQFGLDVVKPAGAVHILYL